MSFTLAAESYPFIITEVTSLANCEESVKEFEETNDVEEEPIREIINVSQEDPDTKILIDIKEEINKVQEETNSLKIKDTNHTDIESNKVNDKLINDQDEEIVFDQEKTLHGVYVKEKSINDQEEITFVDLEKEPHSGDDAEYISISEDSFKNEELVKKETKKLTKKESNNRLFYLISTSKHLRKFVLTKKVEKRVTKDVPYKRTILNYKHLGGRVSKRRKKRPSKKFTHQKRVKILEQISEHLQGPKSNSYFRETSFAQIRNNNFEKCLKKIDNIIENVNSEIVVKQVLDDLFDNVISTISNICEIEDETKKFGDIKIDSEECITDQFLERLNSYGLTNNLLSKETTDGSVINAKIEPSTDNLDTHNVPTARKSSDSTTISLEKTSDITKIKGWRNKQFVKIDNNADTSPSKIEINYDLDPPKLEEKLDLSPPLSNSDSEASTSKQHIFESKELNDLLPNTDDKLLFEIPIFSPIKNVPSSSLQTKDVKRSAKEIRFKSNFKNLHRSIDVKKLKPKTLAEKRYFMKMLQEKEIMHEVELNETSIFRQLKRYENRDPRNAIIEIQRSLQKQTIPITRNCWMSITKSENCGQLIKDGPTTIRIGGSTGRNIIKTNSSPLKPGNKSTKKVRKEQEQEEVSFKPGPLSKKPTLSLNTYGYSNTFIINLPQPYVDVCPELGKPMDPLISRYLQNEYKNGIISDLWAKYSASALITEKPNKHFSFPLQYENDQKKLLMVRRKIYQVPMLKDLCKKVIKNNPKAICLKTPETQIKHDVMMLLSDMLDYVETPILDNSNTPYCPDCPEFKETENKNIDPIPNDVHTVLSGTKKRNGVCRKTELELKRLNVTVIEVELKQNDQETVLKKGKCDKIQCKLGCVCFDSNVEFPEHCGRESCMLECQCKINNKIDRFKERQIISLPEGSNILCSKTVGQLQERAKRNLAKEERKFSQTVIKANDQTIVVGEGCRERRRRTPKMPQKLRDYVNSSAEMRNSGFSSSSDDDEFDDESHIKSLKIWDKAVTGLKRKRQKIKCEDDINSVAFVHIRNMSELKDVIPWCMVHNLYRCFCEGKDLGAVPVLTKKVVVEENKTEVDESIPYSKLNPKRSNKIEISPVSNPPTVVNKPLPKPLPHKLEKSARTRGVPFYYLKRNKTNRFKLKITKLINEFQNQENVPKNVSPAKQVSENTEKITTKKETPKKEIPKSITFRTEPSMLSNECDSITRKLEVKNLPDLLIPYPNIQQHLRSIVFKGSTSKHIFRLMMWNKLFTHYKKNNIFIWHNPNSESGKMVATNSMNDQPSKDFINIKSLTKAQSKDLPNLVSSLLNDSTPGKKEDRPLTFVIFVFNGAHWELRGCIIQKPTDEPYAYVVAKTPSKTTEEETVVAKLKKPKPSATNPFINSVKTSLASKIITDMMSSQLKTNEPTQQFSLESKELPLTLAKPDLKLKETTSPSIRVPIPVGSRDSRWFMLILENDFSILRIMKSQHVLKYSQLKEACQVALKFGKTVRFPLPRPKTQFSNSMPTYGLYAVPGLLERIFFGPYSLDEEHGIITYKYINGKLVNTKDIDVLYSPNEPKSKGIWLYTKGQDISSNGDDTNVTYVDLTVNEENAQNLNDIKDKPCEGKQEIEQKNNLQIPETQNIQNNIIKHNTKTAKAPETPKFITIRPKPTNMTIGAGNQPAINPMMQLVNLEIPRKDGVGDPVKIPAIITFQQRISVESQTPQALVAPVTPDTSTNSKTKESETVTTICIDSDEEKNDSKDTVEPPAAKKIKLAEENQMGSIDKLLPKKSASINYAELATSGKKYWLVPEPYSLGYIELRSMPDGSTFLKNPITGSGSYFPSMGETIQFVDSLLRKHLCFVPLNFQVRMFLVDNLKLFKAKQPLKEELLRGFHMVCANGVFDIEEVSQATIESLNLSDFERNRFEEKQKQISVNKALYFLGSTFISNDQLRSLKKVTVLQKAPRMIEALQKKNVHLKSEKRALKAQKHALLMKKNHLEIYCNLHNIDLRKCKGDTTNPNSSDIEDTNDDIVIIEEVSRNKPATITTEKVHPSKPKISLLKKNSENLSPRSIDIVKPKTTETSRNNSTSEMLKHGLKDDEIEISAVVSQAKSTVISKSNATTSGSNTKPSSKDILNKNESNLLKQATSSLVFVSNKHSALVPSVTKKQMVENQKLLINPLSKITPVNLANIPIITNSKTILKLPNDLSLIQQSGGRFILSNGPNVTTPIVDTNDIIEID